MSMFCCSGIQAYRPQVLAHEQKFRSFKQWAEFPNESVTPSEPSDHLDRLGQPYVIQLVQQINFGAVESKRYFALVDGNATNPSFIEVIEHDLIEANYQKLNSYKNYRCSIHNKFFELNVYEKDPVNKHHWRHNIARPSGEIDL